MVAKERRRDPISPELLKIGVALAFSIGGIVYSFFRGNKGIKKHCKSKPSLSSGNCSQGEDDHALQRSSASITRPSNGNIHDGDREGSILHEFNELLNQHNDSFPSEKGGQSSVLKMDYEYDENEDYDEEIRILQTKVKFLEERERILETQLLEYYGLKEQEIAVMELQNRLRLQNTETQLYKVKIESLQEDKKRLEGQVAAFAEVVSELESAKSKINLLRSKLSSEAKENREQILKLQERVMKLQDNEKKGTEINQDVEMELRKRKELEQELQELKKSNHSLKLENIELAEKLDGLQMIKTSEEEIEAINEERLNLRQENDKLRKEIEQLQDSRCTDLEELVYLRWINACLRYELRNYQPNQGKTVARDLSKTLSPKSEEKAKRLILEYANKEGYRDKALIVPDFDNDNWSSTSQYAESDEFPHDNISSDKRNSSGRKRVFAKLIKLLQGKDSENCPQTPASPLDMAASVDNDTASIRNSYSGSDGGMKPTRTHSELSSRESLDFWRSHSQRYKNPSAESGSRSARTSYDGSMSIFRTFDTVKGYDDSSPTGIQPHQDAENAAKTELVKYAEALKISRGKSLAHRRSASLSFI